MNILRHQLIDRTELLTRLKATRLRGHGQPLIYAQSTLELTTLSPDQLVPAQQYVLQPQVQQIYQLHDYFLTHAIDIFALSGGLLFWVADAADANDDANDAEAGNESVPIPLIPPIVEESHEPDGKTVWLINDGMHRVYAAKQLGKMITVVLVRNVPTAYPYYAYALPHGWLGVEELSEIPDNYRKKAYRDPQNYKALFRDFNAVFPGIQEQRKPGLRS